MLTVFIRLNAVAFIKFFDISSAAFIQGRRLFEGGVYSMAPFVRGRRLFEGDVYLKSNSFLTNNSNRTF